MTLAIARRRSMNAREVRRVMVRGVNIVVDCMSLFARRFGLSLSCRRKRGRYSSFVLWEVAVSGTIDKGPPLGFIFL